MKAIVTTESGSIYEIDDRAMTVIRYPAAGGGELRMDGEVIPIYGWSTLIVGREAVFYVEVLTSIITERRTTPVTSIEWVS